ncbi:CU044_2847 family protein [Nonomuraea sp. NPDC049269]|uniref:CU044_2847 family protein n=1 Tax=Nonomuraea sp. NPDC049269 TaxID=3364349 RepID=UPI00371A8B2E
MSSMLMRMSLDDGSGQFIVADVDAVDLDDVELVSGEGRIAKVSTSLSQAFDNVEPALKMIVTRLRDAAQAPEEITVGFGLKFGGETGLIFAKGKTEASLTVSVTWSKRPKEENSQQGEAEDDSDDQP